RNCGKRFILGVSYLYCHSKYAGLSVECELGGGIVKLKPGYEFDVEGCLLIFVSQLQYSGGLSQSSVVKRLCIPSVKAHRLIAKAVAKGAVKVTIDGEIVECVALENRLCSRFDLDYCEVAPDLGEEGLPLRALSLAGAGFLRREIERGEDSVIGLGHGRTLAATIRQLPRFDASKVRFVSLLGGLTRNYAANPHDVIHRVA